jgi:hypothetical protein
MSRPSSERDYASEPLLERMRRAAAEINAYLLVLAIGLGLLDLTGLVMLVPHVTFTRCIADDPLNTNQARGVITPVVNVTLQSGMKLE